ncbi:MAG TPA: tyrosine-type recombinase/integrase [Acidimicrobiales bacterium]|nr:tyrosine-type recombinase/integrase [Acidimicrobiales bacterium]
MTLLAPTLEAFFSERLIAQRRVSPHTIAAYRDTFRLLLAFTQEKTGRAPSKLRLEDLDATLVGSFLHYLESERGNSPRTRNVRLAAIHSLFRYAALRHPDHAALIERVLAVPSKRFDRTLVAFLSDGEVDALLDAPNVSTPIGRRDHALLLLAIQTGLRVSELVSLKRGDVLFATEPYVRCTGKGRKERSTPLTKTTASTLKNWMREAGGGPDEPLFASAHGDGALSRYAVSVLVARHVATAAQCCSSLQTKRVTPHVLRHTAAMRLLHAGVDSSVIALWLGHESVETTQIYVHADLALKERALDRTTPVGVVPGRYRPPDKLLAFLEAL